MSVINKMLRDLDRRQAAGTSPALSQPSRSGIARDTLIVGIDSKSNDAGRSSRWVAPVLAALAVLLVATAGAWWYLNQNLFVPRKVAQAPSVPKALPAAIPASAVAPIPAPVQAASTAASAPLPALAVSAPAAVAPAVSAPVSAPVPVPVPVPVLAVSTPATSVALADMSLLMESDFKGLPNPEKAAKSKPVATPRPVPAHKAVNERPPRAKAVNPGTKSSTQTAAALPPSALRQTPAQEALAQAQSLWNAGSRQEAIDLLYQALSVVERSSTSGSLAGNKPVLASLARELARMELAEGRVSQTLELLTRLEPALSGVADIWAIRGNAAQRLGRHAESVTAYQRALKLRPNEARWQLGAAVSLAAQGQTVAAAELAEKARAGGALTPELATYLRQLGVPLR